jgi:UDP-GlcNAc:undecaprenyl-phosphate GlcNAc-1-phosphate transferase
MVFYFGIFCGSVLLTALLTRVIRDIAIHRRWLDPANNGRHFHAKPVPRIGGIAIFLGFATTVVGAAMIHLGSVTVALSAHAMLAILLPAFLVLLLGLCDDLFSVSPRTKLAIEALAAAWLYLDGLGVHFLDAYFTSSVLRMAAGLSATVSWVLLISNAFNLIDGLDGLACGSGLMASVVLFVASIWGHAPLTAISAAALAGAALGFLRYNFHPASIFLGDSGSLLLGFVLSGLSFSINSRNESATTAIVPFVCLALPILDVSISIARRFVGSRPLFNGDDEHIHHKLLKRGIPHREAVLLLYGAGAAFSALGLVLLRESRVLPFALVTICIGVWRGIRELEYLEFTELGAAVSRLGLRRASIANNVRLRRAIESIRKAPMDFTELCDALRDALEPIGFSGVAFHFTQSDRIHTRLLFPIRTDVNGRLLLAWRQSHSSSSDWELRLQLVSQAGNRFGELALLRDETNEPLQFDINLLSEAFRTSVANALDVAIQSFPSTSRQASRAKSSASDRTVRASFSRN